MHQVASLSFLYKKDSPSHFPSNLRKLRLIHIESKATMKLILINLLSLILFTLSLSSAHTLPLCHNDESLDLSKNEFVGKIPESIGNLIGLQALNLSYNNFTGSMPRSLANLDNLESLDLSCNLLLGEIPQQLTQLTFLEIFNVSYNHLNGSIPQGNQFSTFRNDSFEGNTGLCGNPLSSKCGESKAQSPPQPHRHSYDGKDEESSTLVDWIIISMGYLSGLVVGVILGHIFTGRYHEWFVDMLGRRGLRNKRKV
ncbi:hypothetical protein Ancab_039688 [Ancistrocladus abbreviatus]